MDGAARELMATIGFEEDGIMPDARPQSFATHRRYVPLYHFVASFILLANLIFALVQVLRGFTADRLMYLLTAAALLIVHWYVRAFAIGVQDRVIRLEERLRLARLLPPVLGPRVAEFTTDQLVALRFASDDELPELVQRVLDQDLQDREGIKRQIKQWRADHCRI